MIKMLSACFLQVCRNFASERKKSSFFTKYFECLEVGNERLDSYSVGFKHMHQWLFGDFNHIINL